MNTKNDIPEQYKDMFVSEDKIMKEKWRVDILSMLQTIRKRVESKRGILPKALTSKRSGIPEPFADMFTDK